MHTPAGPSSHVVRLTVPQTCCAEAARVLVRVFGGEHEARRVVGGVRWWQVRPGDGGCVICSLPPDSGAGADGCDAGSTRSGLWIRGTGRKRSAARRLLLLRQRRRRRSARVGAGAGVRFPSQPRRRQVRMRRLVWVIWRQTRTHPRWTRCGVYCGHMEVRTRQFRAHSGAYSCIRFRIGGYYFGSVDQERYGAIVMRLCALGPAYPE